MTLPPITTKQYEILTLIYRFRFLNRIQLQTLLKHKSKRRINTWLPDLVQKDYLQRIYSNSFTEKTKPAVYFMSSNGIRFLKTQPDYEQKELHKRYYEKDRSPAFIQQCLLLADISLSFQSQSEKSPKADTLDMCATASNIAQEISPFHFLPDLNPSLVIIRRKKNKDQAYLLELFEPTLPRYSVRKRIRTYAEFFVRGEWEESSEYSFPIILLVCPTKPLLISTKRYTKRLKEEDQLSEDLEFWFATEEQVREQGATSEIWEEV